MSLGMTTARSDAEIRKGMSDVTEGVCESVDLAGRLVTVNVSGGSQVMPMVNAAPWPGDRVLVAKLGLKPVCIGMVAKAPLGTVTALPASNRLDVLGDDAVTYRYGYDIDRAYAINDRVMLDHAAQVVVLRISTDPKPETPIVPGGAGGSAISELTFWPVASGNFRSGSYQDAGFEVSDNRTAIYWYGTQIRDTIPANATILEARISLTQEWDKLPGTASRLGIHDRPLNNGLPGLSGQLPISGGTQWRALESFAPALAAGSAFGVGLYSGYGWRRFASAASSGQIYMRWSS